jgi:hypothetical protein
MIEGARCGGEEGGRKGGTGDRASNNAHAVCTHTRNEDRGRMGDHQRGFPCGWCLSARPDWTCR